MMKPQTVKEFFDALPSQFDAEAAEGLAAVYQFDLSGPQGGQYYVEIQDGVCAVSPGVHPEPHVVFSMSDEDCLQILHGQLDGASVAMSGRLRISGDIGLALYLKTLFPTVR